MDPVSSFNGGSFGVGGAGRSNTPSSKNAEKTAGAAGGSFGDELKNALSEVQEMQDKADINVQKMASGEPMDIHEVMVAYEQARLSMQSLIEVRNKLVESYQEISRMPI